MARRVVTVGSSIGLHAKPAGLISAEVFDSGTEVTISLADDPHAERVDASSALVLMTLGADRGSPVVIECDDESVLNRIAAMVETDLSRRPSNRDLRAHSRVLAQGT